MVSVLGCTKSGMEEQTTGQPDITPYYLIFTMLSLVSITVYHRNQKPHRKKEKKLTCKNSRKGKANKNSSHLSNRDVLAERMISKHTAQAN